MVDIYAASYASDNSAVMMRRIGFARLSSGASEPRDSRLGPSRIAVVLESVATMIPRKCNFKPPIVVACCFRADFAANDFGRLVPSTPVAMAATPAQRQCQRQRENSLLSPDGCKLTTRGRGATQHASSISFEQLVGFFPSHHHE